MVQEEEIKRKIAFIRQDYEKCRVCKEIIHISDKKCRWCGSKRTLKAISVDVYRWLLILLTFLLFFAAGYINVSLYLVTPLAVITSYFLSKKYAVKWLARNRF